MLFCKVYIESILNSSHIESYLKLLRSIIMLSPKEVIEYSNFFGGVAIFTTTNTIEISFNSTFAKLAFLQRYY